MSEDVLQRIALCLSETRSFLGEINILWHAGEPLVVPINFYRKAFAIFGELSSRKPLFHSIQTNGTLITKDWADFFESNNVSIGVSLDGPQFIHDRSRRDRRSRGTHARVLQGIQVLKQRQIDLSIICVLTDFSLDYPDEIFNFFVELGVKDVGFNIDEIENVNTHSSFEVEGSTKRFRNFMERLWDLMEIHSPDLEVREFSKAIHAIFRSYGRGTYVNAANQPLGILTIDYRGNFSTFCPELRGARNEEFSDFVMGNILVDDIDSIFTHETFGRVWSQVELGIDNCRTKCSYFDVCGGGNPANKFFEHGSFDSTQTIACEFSKKIVTDVVLDRLERLVRC